MQKEIIPKYSIKLVSITADNLNQLKQIERIVTSLFSRLINGIDHEKFSSSGYLILDLQLIRRYEIRFLRFSGKMLYLIDT